MRKTSIVEGQKWKRIAIGFVWLFVFTAIICCFLVTKTDYPDRIATKLGLRGGGIILLKEKGI